MNVLVTHFFPRCSIHEEIFGLTSAFNRDAADRLGWKFFSDSKRRVPLLNVWREKSAIISESLDSCSDGDCVLWVDADVLLVGKEIESIFYDINGFDYGMRKLYGRWNSGVVPMIVSDNVRKLWIEMRDHEHMGDTPIIDGLKNESTNEVLIDAGIRNSWVANECATCPYPPGNRGPLCGSEYVKLAELESRWNEMPDCVNEKTQIVGFHRHNAFTKRRQIKGFIAKWQPF